MFLFLHLLSSLFKINKNTLKYNNNFNYLEENPNLSLDSKCLKSHSTCKMGTSQSPVNKEIYME